MFVPLILSALLPLNPMLFLRELIAWFVGVFLDTLDDPQNRAWIRANPRDRRVRLGLLGSLVLIEDMIAAFIHARARQMLGQPPRGGRRKTAKSSYRLTGHPPSFEDIERRFHRALARLADVERLAARRAAKIARLLEQAASQFEIVHHPVAPSTTTIPFAPDSTIPPAPDSTTTILQALASTTIPRGPPWRGTHLRKNRLNPTRRPRLRDRTRTPSRAHAPDSPTESRHCPPPKQALERQSTIKAQRDELPGGGGWRTGPVPRLFRDGRDQPQSTGYSRKLAAGALDNSRRFAAICGQRQEKECMLLKPHRGEQEP